VALILAASPAHALVSVDDRTRLRLGVSRHRLTVVKGRKTIVLRLEAVNRGEDPHDVAIRRVGGRRLATTGLLRPGGGIGQLRVRLKPSHSVELVLSNGDLPAVGDSHLRLHLQMRG